MRNHRNSPQAKQFSYYSIDDLKHRASGRWVEILQAAGMPSELLESRRGMPCPKCGGSDRFGIMKDLAQRGAVLCRHCFNGHTDPRSGDGLSTLQWWLGMNLSDAVRWLVGYLGEAAVPTRSHQVIQSIPIANKSIDSRRFQLFSEVCRRNMRPGWLARAAALIGLPPDSLARLSVGWSVTDLATTWPMRNGFGDVTGIRLRDPKSGKKWSVKGSVAGLFYDPALLSIEHPKRLWIVEGPTDTAAMLSLGLDAAGCPSAGGGVDALVDLTHRILPSEIVILADRDRAGICGAERLSDALLLIAPVRIVMPPDGLKDARSWVCSGVCRNVIDSEADFASVRSVVMEGE